MHEKGDTLSIDLLNKIRWKMLIRVVKTFQSQDSCKERIVNIHFMRCTFLLRIPPSPNKLFSIPVKDKIPKHCSILDISEVQNPKQSETGNF